MKKMMYFAAALLVLVGCNKKENAIENTPKEVVTIKGSIELPQTPHKIAAPTGWESATEEFGMRWEENDQIYIYNDLGECSLFTIASGAGDNEASFNGSPLSSMEGYNVAYGYNPQESATAFEVPYIEGNYRPFAEGTGIADGFSINKFGPVIGLQLKGDGVFSKIEVALLNDSKATLATYTMTFAEALALNESTATNVYFPIQANADAAEIAISFYKKVNSEEVLTLTKTTNMPEANKVTTFPVLTFQSAYEYVDLGLPSGLKWATCNVGATAPEGNGDYFAWGETEPYYADTTTDPITWKAGKEEGYNWQSYEGYTSEEEGDFTEWTHAPYDDNEILKPEYDAATANWGGNWRMPTVDEFHELLENCDFEETTLNGVYGYKFTSKVSGYENNSIFLPASGARYDSLLGYFGSDGYYWSSSHYHVSQYAYVFSFNSDEVYWDYASERLLGESVRPVCE